MAGPCTKCGCPEANPRAMGGDRVDMICDYCGETWPSVAPMGAGKPGPHCPLCHGDDVSRSPNRDMPFVCGGCGAHWGVADSVTI